MEKTIFRKKSLDKINSPESLNEYLRVTNPGMWIVLLAIVVFLVGSIIWGVNGRIETTLKTTAIAENGVVSSSINSQDVTNLTSGMMVRISDKNGSIKSINKSADSTYEIIYDIEIADGVYSAEIITESISPLSLVFN